MTSNNQTKVGVYVDGENIRRNGGYRMQYDVLREFACRDGAIPQRLNTYLAFDQRRAKEDNNYLQRERNFHSRLRDYGFKVIQKLVRWYCDAEGEMHSKANADLDLAVDVLLQSENLDRVVLASGDGDFIQVVRALQSKGCRVEVVGFENVSSELRREADMYFSGYLIPGLVPATSQNPEMRSNAEWGGKGSRVRGFCYYHHDSKPFGFFRYLRHVSPDIWITDSRDQKSPYETIFFYDHDLPSGIVPNNLPHRDTLFEFELSDPRNDGENRQAINITLVNTRPDSRPPASP